MGAAVDNTSSYVSISGSVFQHSVGDDLMATTSTPLGSSAPAQIAPPVGDRRWVAPVFGMLFVVLGLQTAHEVVGLAGGGHSRFFDSYLYDVVIAACGLLMVARGTLARRERAWVVIGIGTLLWLAGDIVWDVNFGAGSAKGTPHVSASDGFWLSWYAFVAVGMVMLVRSYLRGFDLARWIDGLALALLVATPGVALALQPVIEASHARLLEDAVIVAYPACDILLLGSALGVIALAGWRPGRPWYVLSLGLSTWLIADALYSVQEINGTYVSGTYDFLWPAGMLLAAYAAWLPWKPHEVREPLGWRAVALPIACQAAALGTQVWGLLAPLGESERVMTIAVLLVVIVQLYLSRPRPKQRSEALDPA